MADVRLEGEEARPRATITIDGQAVGTADGDWDFEFAIKNFTR